MKGRLITFEGSEGSGKSTQIKLLTQHLKSQHKNPLWLREPGGVRISETIRRILLDVKNQKMNEICETLLYMAARSQLVSERILPALRQGRVVLCDRFLDSTIVYQGYGNGVDLDFIRKIGKYAAQDIQPDITFIFDIEVQKGLFRKGQKKDRIEQRSLEYHRRVRAGYLKLAGEEPQRIKLIQGSRSKEEIQQEIRRWVDRLLEIYSPSP